MPEPTGFSLGVSRFRRPTLETMPTDVKTGALYPNNARALARREARGFGNAIVLDMLGNVAETATVQPVHRQGRRRHHAGAERHLPQRHHPAARRSRCCARMAARCSSSG